MQIIYFEKKTLINSKSSQKEKQNNQTKPLLQRIDNFFQSLRPLHFEVIKINRWGSLQPRILRLNSHGVLNIQPKKKFKKRKKNDPINWCTKEEDQNLGNISSFYSYGDIQQVTIVNHQTLFLVFDKNKNQCYLHREAIQIAQEITCRCQIWFSRDLSVFEFSKKPLLSKILTDKQKFSNDPFLFSVSEGNIYQSYEMDHIEQLKYLSQRSRNSDSNFNQRFSFQNKKIYSTNDLKQFTKLNSLKSQYKLISKKELSFSINETKDLWQMVSIADENGNGTGTEREKHKEQEQKQNKKNEEKMGLRYEEKDLYLNLKNIKNIQIINENEIENDNEIINNYKIDKKKKTNKFQTQLNRAKDKDSKPKERNEIKEYLEKDPKLSNINKNKIEIKELKPNINQKLENKDGINIFQYNNEIERKKMVKRKEGHILKLKKGGNGNENTKLKESSTLSTYSIKMGTRTTNKSNLFSEENENENEKEKETKMENNKENGNGNGNEYEDENEDEKEKEKENTNTNKKKNEIIIEKEIEEQKYDDDDDREEEYENIQEKKNKKQMSLHRKKITKVKKKQRLYYYNLRKFMFFSCCFKIAKSKDNIDQVRIKLLVDKILFKIKNGFISNFIYFLQNISKFGDQKQLIYKSIKKFIKMMKIKILENYNNKLQVLNKELYDKKRLQEFIAMIIQTRLEEILLNPIYPQVMPAIRKLVNEEQKDFDKCLSVLKRYSQTQIGIPIQLESSTKWFNARKHFKKINNSNLPSIMMSIITKTGDCIYETILKEEKDDSFLNATAYYSIFAYLLIKVKIPSLKLKIFLIDNLANKNMKNKDGFFFTSLLVSIKYIHQIVKDNF
ncbi:kinesin-like protein klp98a [Anaeramoeba flamelloides]|uniref:Kinesin-like protein klp98a n=1 Tax=Anaeramoeba flamelloides TaxID=1746091 RepID=A0ABQ8YI47_9EUKA|nr:kinesin-like protein klp98a [Anaeramoeba flamelloides]